MKQNKEQLIVIHTATIQTKVGPLHLYAQDEALLGIYFDDNKARSQKRFAKYQVRKMKNEILKTAEKQIREFLDGKRKDFDLPLVIEGTPFEQMVWKSLLKIPYGKFISYSAQARSVKKAAAVRAVASANGRNPLPLIFPCHRVVRADESIGGYSGGLAWKKYLMMMESAKA